MERPTEQLAQQLSLQLPRPQLPQQSKAQAQRKEKAQADLTQYFNLQAYRLEQTRRLMANRRQPGPVDQAAFDGLLEM